MTRRPITRLIAFVANDDGTRSVCDIIEIDRRRRGHLTARKVKKLFRRYDPPVIAIERESFSDAERFPSGGVEA